MRLKNKRFGPIFVGADLVSRIRNAQDRYQQSLAKYAYYEISYYFCSIIKKVEGHIYLTNYCFSPQFWQNPSRQPCVWENILIGLIVVGADLGILIQNTRKALQLTVKNVVREDIGITFKAERVNSPS